jgi:hypothetical protein
MIDRDVLESGATSKLSDARLIQIYDITLSLQGVLGGQVRLFRLCSQVPSITGGVVGETDRYEGASPTKDARCLDPHHLKVGAGTVSERFYVQHDVEAFV